MLSKDDFIYGEKFEMSCDFPPYIYFCKTDFVWQFVEFAKNIPNNFIVVSHNSDHSINQNLSDYIDLYLPNLKKWYGQNINCFNTKIESIPIGLENTKNWTKFSKSDLLYKSSSKKTNPSKLVYANFSLWTNPVERQACKSFIDSVDFITDKCSYEVVQDNYQKFIDEVLDHEFVLCPMGNGIDTHRLWEVLYLGRVPITKRNLNSRFYEKLPIMLVDDWTDLNEDFLREKIDFYRDRTNFDYNLLKMSYWIDKIKKDLL